jgi:hypothetical protein
MISEKQKLILWPVIEEFFDINPRECGVGKRDEVEHFFSKIIELFNVDSSEELFAARENAYADKETIEGLLDSIDEAKGILNTASVRASYEL